MKSLKRWEVAEFAERQGQTRQTIEGRIKRGWKFGVLDGKEVIYNPKSVEEVKGQDDERD